MADTIPELIQRLTGEDAAEQKQAAGQLGSLAYRLAHNSSAEVPQLEPAVAPLTELVSSDSADLQLAAATALTHLCKASPSLAAAVGCSGAAPALVQLLRAAEGSNAQEVAAAALGALMLGAEGRQAAKEAGADEALIECWQDSEPLPHNEWTLNKAAVALVNGVLAGVHQAAPAVETEGAEAQQAQRDVAAQQGGARIKELVDHGADGGAFLKVLFIRAIEQKGTDAALVGKLLYAAAEQGALQGPDVEEAAVCMLCDTDDISVDCPRAPLIVGEALGGLVAGGALDLAAIAEHVRTARSDEEIKGGYEEGEDTMLVGGGGATKVIGCLLRRLAAEKGQQAASEAWQASGERLAAFLPEDYRNDTRELKRMVEQFGLEFLWRQCRR